MLHGEGCFCFFGWWEGVDGAAGVDFDGIASRLRVKTKRARMALFLCWLKKRDECGYAIRNVLLISTSPVRA